MQKQPGVEVPQRAGHWVGIALAAIGGLLPAAYLPLVALPAGFGQLAVRDAAMFALLPVLGAVALIALQLWLARLTGAADYGWRQALRPLLAGWLCLPGYFIAGSGGAFHNPLGMHKYFLLAAFAGNCAIAAGQLAMILRTGRAARGGLIAGVAALLLYLAAYPAIRLHEVHGDEPYYLWMTRSITADGDLDLTNNVAARLHERLLVYPLPDGSQRLYSGYLPAYAALLVPGHALAGDNGAVLLQLLISALLAAQLYLLLTEAYGAAAGWYGWIIAAATAPLATLATHIYPETAAALLVTLALRRLWFAHGARPAVTALLIGALPWLHPRYAYLAVVLGAALLWRQRRAWRPAAAAALTLLLMAGGAWLHRWSLTPQGYIGGESVLRPDLLPSQIARFFLDQEYGLWFLAPVYLLLPAAVIVGWRSQLPAARLAIALLAAFCLFHGLFAIWGIGSVSGRYITPLAPALALLMTALWSVAKPALRRGLLLLLALSVVLTLLSSIAPVLRFERADGYNRLAAILYPQLTQVLPSMVNVGTRFSLPLDGLGYLWLLAVLVVNGWGWAVGGRGGR